MSPTVQAPAREIPVDTFKAFWAKAAETAIPPPILNLNVLKAEGSPLSASPTIDPVSGRVAVFDSAIASQGSDHRWANEVMTAAQAASEGVEGANIDSLECGKDLCRLEIGATAVDPDAPVDEHPNASARSLVGKMAIETGERSFGMTAPPMPRRLVVYIARENTRLPSLFE
jgi:hypothetical protein